MAIFSAGNINSGSIASRATGVCAALRNTLEDVQDLHKFISAQNDADMTALGFTAGDLGLLRSAVADANALAQIFFTGQPPGTYPQAPSAYTYASSTRLIVGPQ